MSKKSFYSDEAIRNMSEGGRRGGLVKTKKGFAVMDKDRLREVISSRRVKSTFNHEEFINIWNSAKNIDEIIQVTGLLYATAVKRAHRLRARGYDVKKFG